MTTPLTFNGKLTLKLTDEQPMLTFKIQGKKFEDMFDSDTKVSVISL